MAREDWEDREEARPRDYRRARGDFGQADYSGDYGYDSRGRTGYRAEDDLRGAADDYGQADYSTDYAFDADGRRVYRRYSDDDVEYRRRAEAPDDYRPAAPRSWIAGAGEFFSGRPRSAPRRRGPSDRVLWAVISERLEDERGLDLRDVEVVVENAEVTLNGVVRRKVDKRRIEDVADIDGVRHVQNNLRVRGHGYGHWTFL